MGAEFSYKGGAHLIFISPVNQLDTVLDVHLRIYIIDNVWKYNDFYTWVLLFTDENTQLLLEKCAKKDDHINSAETQDRWDAALINVYTIRWDTD